ncbi:RDD family protein [Photobacterium sp. SDRW27]|uniref:RDD family protein n=1 Tax=Photobacterium obscurum TaxID=2829490 RepID=UPI0022445C53|nr:RDD family protein [Photobacterium obscurum]MCW8330946.1 RDD family protein [Photobacterium obscurum]
MENQQAETQHENNLEALELATKWSRLGASLIDGFIISVFTMPLIYFMGGFDGVHQNPTVQAPLSMLLFGAFIGVLLYAAINWKLLETKGQSIGKKLLKIRVVYLDGAQASRKDILLKRYCPYVFSAYIPFVGALVSLFNVLFIFGKQRRCLHDRLAGTKVVKA